MGSARNVGAGGHWVPLSGTYFFDDRIADAGPAAELLFVRGLAYCAQSLSDGFMSARQVRRLVAVGLDDVDDLCKALVEAGLWDRDEERDGYVVRRWLKWNWSREEIERYRGRDAARKRAARKAVDGRAESERTSARTPHGIPPLDTDTDQIKRSDRTSGPVRSDLRASDPDEAELRARIEEATRAVRRRATEDAG